MTLYYTLVFGLMVAELAIFCLLILPLPLKWRRTVFTFLSNSPIIGKLQYGLKITFIFVFILFVDSLNRMIRVSEEVSNKDHHIHDIRTETNLQARKFYSQRNMYLTGSTLFLSLILNRTYYLILELLESEKRVETLKAQIAGLTDTRADGDLQKKIDQLSKELKEEKQKSLDFDTLNKQSQNAHNEYMRLSEKYNELEKASSGSNETKKGV